MELDDFLFDPAQVVDTVVRLFAERAEGKGLELAYRIDDAVPPQVIGDGNRLRQVLVNLLGNALKFTEAGEIFVSCQADHVSPESASLRFRIRDTGCGITAEKQKLLFNAFSQADSSMARRHGGTGLGLAISRQFCELMGGDIGVQSEPGKGSVFWFTLRVKLPRQEAAAAAARAPLGLRVLVVDDSETARILCREFIAVWKGDADEASDGAMALQKLKAAASAGRPFNVAVLDWRMPGMDGVALAKCIKADPQLSAIGLVLLSGFSHQGLSEDLAAAGFAASISKPASKSDLYDALVTATNGTLLLPPNPAAAAKAKTPAAAMPITGTVLLAEDNEINREVAAEMLVEQGCGYRWVRNGIEAIEAWRQGRMDLILMDCQMPEMDGYEATRVIRGEEERSADKRHIPIVALTAHATKGDRDRCLQTGMDDYLTKPLEPQLLSVMLAKWLRPKTAAKNGANGGPSGDPVDYPDLLRRCMGKTELAERLLRKLTQQADEDLQAIGKAVEQKDAAALAASAHRLKGASANVSATCLRQAAAEMEELGRNGRPWRRPAAPSNVWLMSWSG